MVNTVWDDDSTAMDSPVHDMTNFLAAWYGQLSLDQVVILSNQSSGYSCDHSSWDPNIDLKSPLKSAFPAA